jgi:hypothetical protein
MSNECVGIGMADFWQLANHLLERTERYSLEEWMLIGACALFVSVIYLLTKQR